MHAERLYSLWVLAGMHTLSTGVTTHDPTTFKTSPMTAQPRFVLLPEVQSKRSRDGQVRDLLDVLELNNLGLQLTIHAVHLRKDLVGRQTLHVAASCHKQSASTDGNVAMPLHMGRPCQVPANTAQFVRFRCTTSQGDGGELT